MKFAIKRSKWMRPILAIFGATSERSYVDVSNGKVHLRFGPFDETVAKEDIKRVDRAKWSWIGGIGWRLVHDGVGVVGSLEDVVAIELKTRKKVKLFPPLSIGCEKIYVSLEDPDGFIAAATAK